MLLKNENKRSEMIDIMETQQQYVPIQTSSSDLEAHQILFGGDQLAAARTRDVQT